MRKIAAWILGGLMLMCGCLYGCKRGESGGQKSEIPDGYLPENATLMFDEPASAYAIYNYCPSILQVSETERHAYYCSNELDNNVRDYVAYRKGLKIEGVWYWSEKSLVLSPTEDTWDAMHTCDPDVIMGEFAYNGKTYPYLMTYLGCVTTNNQSNEVGLAVAEKPEGPWIKCDSINPIVKYDYDISRPDVFQWGYGQSSLVSVDKKGKALLIYTQGTVTEGGLRAERWDFSNLSDPRREFSEKVPLKGVTQHNGTAPATMTNADFGWDAANKRLYVVCDGFPFDDENRPTFVAAASYVGYIDDLQGEGSLAGDVFKAYNGASWRKVTFIDEGLTGFARNHNACLVTDGYGHMLAPERLEVAYTVAELNQPSDSLWTYRIHRKELTLSEY